MDLPHDVAMVHLAPHAQADGKPTCSACRLPWLSQPLCSLHLAQVEESSTTASTSGNEALLNQSSSGKRLDLRSGAFASSSVLVFA